MNGLILDAAFLFEKIAWMKWLVAGFFFLLGLFVGWWKWRNQRVAEKETNREPLKLSSSDGDAVAPENPGDDLATGEFGPIYHSEPDEIDDLQKIKGIGKALRAKLYSLGIFRFEQIANWSKSEVAAVSKKLHLANRIDTDGWQDQAKSLDGNKT